MWACSGTIPDKGLHKPVLNEVPVRERASSLVFDFPLTYLELNFSRELVRGLKALATSRKNIYLTNRFHVAVRLFSNRSQMTSKCSKNKKVAHEAIAECVTDVLTTF